VGKLIERRKSDPETGEVKVVQRFKQTSFLGKVRESALVVPEVRHFVVDLILGPLHARREDSPRSTP
jgi:hypothetical protein